MKKALSVVAFATLIPSVQATEIIAEQNFNALSSSGTYTTDDVTSGSPLTNSGSFNNGGEGLDFQTYWFDTRGIVDGPVDSDEGNDFIGVNSFTGSNSPDVSAAGVPIGADVEHNFEFNDADGRLDLVFEAVDVSSFEERQLTLNFWVADTSFEEDDSFVISLSDGSTSVDVYSVSGSALQDLTNGDAASASEWQALSVDLEDVMSSNALGETLTLTVSVDNNSGSENIFIDDVVFTSGSENDDADDGEVALEIGACSATDTTGFQYISAVQGTGEASPYVDQQVIIEGVVTGSRDGGFFIQEENADEDNDALSSEGIFVFYADVAPATYSTVRVLGTVVEFFNLTEITNVSDLIDCNVDGSSAVSTASISFPLSDAETLEQYEGMLVEVSNLTVFDTANLWRFGDLGLSTSVKVQPTDLYAPLTAEYNAQVSDNETNIIYIEDSSSSSFPDALSYFTNFSYANAINIGDTVSASGPLNYSFGAYKINPNSEIALVSSRQASPEIDGGDVKIASFNVLNYFNGELDSNGEVTFDYDANRGAENEEEFALQQARIVEAIVAMDADIIGLMEIENDGFGADSAIQSLVDAVNAQFAEESQYSFVSTADDSLVGSDAIAVGLIYRDSVVALSGDAVKIDMPEQLQSDDVSLRQMRVSLLQTFTHIDSEEQLAIVVNHFKSKGSGCYEDEVETTDIDTIQGNCNAFRVSAAVALGDALAAAELPEKVMILGDLNAYSQEDPVAVLTSYDPASRGYTITTAVRTGLNNGESVEVTETYGYQNVFDTQDEYGFSYWFFGNQLVGSLDHALASQSLMEDIVDATHWNINSVEAFQLQYDQALSFYPTEEGYAFTDIGPFRSSDHDPLIVSIAFETQDDATDDDSVVDDEVEDNNDSGGAINLYAIMLALFFVILRRRTKLI